jgi:hypothetical protein
MSVLGTGIMPATGAVASELTAVTRRGFVPKMVVQIYKSCPLIAACLANANTASGGVSSITQPVQGASYVNHQWSDYSGGFSQPPTQTGAQNAEFNLKLSIIPVPFLGLEGIVQLGHEVIPIIEARMNDAEAVAKDAWATALYNNTTNAQAFIGLPAYVDDTTNVHSYGNIDGTGAGNGFWKSTYVANSPAINPTRAAIMIYINTLVKAVGEAPTMGVMGFGTWTKLAEDFLSQERYDVKSGFSMGGVETGFRALMVAGVPIFADPYCPEGTLYLLNTNYMAFHIHEQAAMAFTGFQSTIPAMQLGYVGAVVTVAEFVGVKRKANAQVRGLNYENI